VLAPDRAWLFEWGEVVKVQIVENLDRDREWDGSRVRDLAWMPLL